MPHVSKNKLEDRELSRIYTQLLNTFEKSFSKNQKGLFHKEFFTKTERIMFSKRLAIIAMLSRGVRPSYISEALKVSRSTVDKISLKIETGRLKSVIVTLNKRPMDWVKLIEKIMSAGLPPIAGRGRWKGFYERTDSGK